MKTKNIRRPGSRGTVADRLRKTLGTNRAVLFASRVSVGGYHHLLAPEGLRVRSRKTAGGWACWVEPMKKNGRA